MAAMLPVCAAALVPVAARAVPEGCSESTASVRVESEDTNNTYYVVATTANQDARAKKEKADRVTLEIDAKMDVEGVDKDGAPIREEVPLHFRLAGVRYGSYSRTVKGPIRGPQVNRRILGINIQRVSCVWQDPGDETEEATVN